VVRRLWRLRHHDVLLRAARGRFRCISTTQPAGTLEASKACVIEAQRLELEVYAGTKDVLGERHENMSEAAATRRAELILNVRVPILKIRRAEIATAFDLGANTRGL
jgi:hypothetical protein